MTGVVIAAAVLLGAVIFILVITMRS